MRYFLLVLCFFVFNRSNSQGVPEVPILPAMKIETEKATNIITWNCQFDGVKSIAIQRSSDSVRNYVTIYVVNKVKRGLGSFADLKPMIGKNYYRLSINFAGDMEWYSNTYRVFLDSATIAKSIEEAILTGISKSVSLGATNAIGTSIIHPIKPIGNENGNSASPATTVTANNVVNTPTPPVSLEFHYSPSSTVYTNPYSGHINIQLDDFQGKKYSVRFFTPGKNSEEVLRIGRVTRKMLVVDKNNFNSTGTYKFELYNGNDKLETGYVTIY